MGRHFPDRCITMAVGRGRQLPGGAPCHGAGRIAPITFPFGAIVTVRDHQHCCSGDLGHEILVSASAAAGTVSLARHHSFRRSSTELGIVWTQLRGSSPPHHIGRVNSLEGLLEPRQHPSDAISKRPGSSPVSVQRWGARESGVKGTGVTSWTPACPVKIFRTSSRSPTARTRV